MHMVREKLLFIRTVKPT